MCAAKTRGLRSEFVRMYEATNKMMLICLCVRSHPWASRPKNSVFLSCCIDTCGFPEIFISLLVTSSGVYSVSIPDPPFRGANGSARRGRDRLLSTRSS